MEGMNTSGSRFVASKLYEVCVKYRITNISVVLEYEYLFYVLSWLSYCASSRVSPYPFTPVQS